MPGFLIRLALNVLGLWLATQIVPGMRIVGLPTFLAAGLLLGIVNAVVRPIVVVLTLPFTVLTLGLFILVVNAAMLALVSWLLGNFQLAGFWAAFFGAIVVGLTGWIGSSFVDNRGRVEVMVIESRPRP
jgi:putative membrane protein